MKQIDTIIFDLGGVLIDWNPEYVFLDVFNHQFMGIIKGVSEIGKLQVMLEDDSIQEFNIKEIKMLY